MKCESCSKENLEGARYCASCGALLPIESTGGDPMIGKTIGGRYRVTGVLGEGGMGIVYVGEQPMGSTLRKVAIKTLHLHLSKDPSVLARFHRECGTVAQLEHPNTIKFYDFGSTDDGTLYIAMEFVAGKALSEVLSDEVKLPPARVIHILRQVCGALDEAHRQGVIHRDLKPENVILADRAGEQDFVKVLDFGIAARTESTDAQKEQKLTQQGMVLGTPPYMSPEQFTGKALDARSDVYSLGVMAYEMLSGRLPFEADTPWQWATQHMTAQPIPFEVSAPAANIPEGMRQAIFRALSKDRDQRQQSARQFFAQLSEGERFTAPQAPDGRAGTGTAAMAQSPELAATVPPGFGPAAQAPMAAPAQMAAPMAPGPMPPQPYQPTPGAFGAPIPAVPPRRSGRGGKGLIIGLAVVVVLLGIGGAVFALRQLRPPPDEPQALTNPFASASSPTVAAVQAETPGATTQQPAQTVEEPTTTAAGHLPRGTKPGKPAASASAQPSAQPSASSTTASSGPDSCDECISAARSGNIVGASSLYAKCSDPSKKDRCSRSARGTVGGPIKSAALNGDCPKAKAIAAAARQMDVASGVIDNALGPCK